MASVRTSERQRQFKKGIDQDATRRRREDTTIQIRKSQRETRLNQRRRMGPVGTQNSNEEANQSSCPISDEKLAELPALVEELHSRDSQIQFHALQTIRQLLSVEVNPPIQQVINANAVPIFVELLKREDNPSVQFEAAWALTNIASGTSDHTVIVIQNGAVPWFCKMLHSADTNVLEQAVWALGNIAGDSPACRDLIIESDALPPLLDLLGKNNRVSVTRNGTWTLSNLCRGKPQPDFSKLRHALPTLAQLIYSQDTEILTDACWCLSYLSDGTYSRVQGVLESGAPKRLIELLLHPSPSVQVPALRTIGNIVTGNTLQTEVIITCDALPSLYTLLFSSKKSIRKEACWTISNITAGDKYQIQAVVDAKIIPELLRLLSEGEYDVKKEACWAISNSTSGATIEQLKYLVACGCIQPMCNMLGSPDSKIIIVALEGLENILKAGERDAAETGSTENVIVHAVDEADGIDKIQNLQYHENEAIYEKAVKIVERFFGTEEGEDEFIAPHTDAAANQFQFGTSSNVATSVTGQKAMFNFAQGGSN